MPWWSWLLIWSLLALGLLVVFGLCARTLFGKAMGTLRALESLGDQISALDCDQTPTTASISPAIFADAAVLRGNIERAGVERAHRRQLRRDALIVRGKLLSNAR